MPHFKTVINQKTVLANSILADYTLYHRSSTFIQYIGVRGDNSLFVQFCNSTCFIYPDLPIDLIKQAVSAPSISNFYQAQLKGKYQGEAIESHCIVDEEDEDNDQYDPYENNYDEGWDSF